jgi:hypothetical protein
MALHTRLGTLMREVSGIKDRGAAADTSQIDYEMRLIESKASDQVKEKIQNVIDRVGDRIQNYYTDMALKKVRIRNVENKISKLETDRDLLIGIPRSRRTTVSRGAAAKVKRCL